MFRKVNVSLVAVAALSLAGATAAGAQQYTPNSMGTTASSAPAPDDEVISRDVSRDPGDPGDGAVVLGAGQSRPAAGPLARTGLDTGTLGGMALGLFAAGTVLVAASRRPTRRA